MIKILILFLATMFSGDIPRTCETDYKNFDYEHCKTFDELPLNLSTSFIQSEIGNIRTTISSSNGSFGTASSCDSPENFGTRSIVVDHYTNTIFVSFDDYVSEFSFGATNHNGVVVFCYDNQLFLPPIIAWTLYNRPTDAPGYSRSTVALSTPSILSCVIFFGGQSDDDIMLDNFCVFDD